MNKIEEYFTLYKILLTLKKDSAEEDNLLELLDKKWSNMSIEELNLINFLTKTFKLINQEGIVKK